MVESRVVVPNAAGVHGHMRRAVVQVVDAVEAWLKLWTGDRSYTVVGPVPVRSTR